MKKAISFFLTLVLILFLCPAVFAAEDKIEIKVLILPKFENGSLTGDSLGEAQYYYEGYLMDSDAYEIAGSQLYVRDGVALYLTGMGKVNAAVSTMAVLTDDRFDFSNAYIISTGCAGSAVNDSVMGDVYIITAAVDYDLGHHVDVREMEEPTVTTWFHDADFDDSSVVMLNPELMDQVYALVKDVPVETTENTRKYMSDAFEGAEWAIRDPAVRRGTTVTGDNYWRGVYGNENALLMVETYGCPDPFALSDMEDIAIAVTAKRMGMLDRLIIIRDSVNMDVYMLGTTPESTWGEQDSLSANDSIEVLDIFDTAMKNNFKVGKVVIDAILEGKIA